MKQREINELIESVKRVPTIKMKSAISDFEDYEKLRREKNGMYFWNGDNGNMSIRDRRCDTLSKDLTTKLGKHTIHYTRTVHQSRSNTYAKDSLMLDGKKVTIADLKKIAEKLNEIIERRA